MATSAPRRRTIDFYVKQEGFGSRVAALAAI